MKTKLLLMVALIGAISFSARAGVFIGVSVGIPAPRMVIAAPVVPVAPVVVVAPACPAPGYVWVPGYWTGYGAARVWVGGCWRPGPVHVVYAHSDYGHRYGGWHH